MILIKLNNYMDLQFYSKRQLEKFLNFKKKQNRLKLLELSDKYDYSLNKINMISDNNIINKIQVFFRKHRFI